MQPEVVLVGVKLLRGGREREGLEPRLGRCRQQIPLRARGSRTIRAASRKTTASSTPQFGRNAARATRSRTPRRRRAPGACARSRKRGTRRRCRAGRASTGAARRYASTSGRARTPRSTPAIWRVTRRVQNSSMPGARRRSSSSLQKRKCSSTARGMAGIEVIAAPLPVGAAEQGREMVGGERLHAFDRRPAGARRATSCASTTVARGRYRSMSY